MKQIQCVLVLLALTIGMSDAFAIMPFRRYHVHIVNGLKNGKLHSHCRSGDTDLGARETPVNGEYEWGFRINFQGSTLYHCGFWWRGGRLTAVEVFKTDDKFVIDLCGGKTCTWKAADDGLYFYNAKKKSFEFKQKWGKL